MVIKHTIDSATRKATYSGVPVDVGAERLDYMLVTLNISSAERDSGDETYDFYLTTENESGARWDLVHFPQVVTTGAKVFVARLRSDLFPQNVTTAAPGVAANDSATLSVATGATNATKSLVAGSVRNGQWGNRLGYELVVAGTVVTGIAFTLTAEGHVDREIS